MGSIPVGGVETGTGPVEEDGVPAAVLGAGGAALVATAGALALVRRRKNVLADGRAGDNGAAA